MCPFTEIAYYLKKHWTLWILVRSVPRHFGPRSEVSRDTLAPGPKCPTLLLSGHFKPTLLGPKCPVTHRSSQ